MIRSVFFDMANNLTNPEYFDMAGVVYEISQRNQQHSPYSEAARVYVDPYPKRYLPDRRQHVTACFNPFPQPPPNR